VCWRRRANLAFEWRPIPGSTLEAADIANQQLRDFVELARKLSGSEGDALLELVGLVRGKVDSMVSTEDPALAVLFGRPLALARAALGLEFDGLPAGYWHPVKDSNNKWKWTFISGGIEKLRVPVKLGGLATPGDGLLGYMPASDHLVTAWGAVRHVAANEHIRYQDGALLNCGLDPVELTLLMDAGARVHATTDLLPRHYIELPPEAARQASLIETFYIRTAPILGERTPDGKPAMPRPSDAFGRWSWIPGPRLNGGEILASDDRARFARDLALSEGWLMLSRSQPAAARPT
jgi:hypothetical protein